MKTLLRLQVTLLIVLFSVQFGISQDSWKKLSSNGERLFQEGKYAESGDAYFAAWKIKPKKTELAFKAGDAYYMTRDYNKAEKAYKVVKDNNSEYHHVGFKYARCLKSMEQYDDASREFVYFINNYDGDDYKNMSQLVQTEILGCELGIKDVDSFQKRISVTHLSESINTGSMEYAPLPFSDDILYFSSDKSGSSKIYRTQFLDGSWTKSKATDKIFNNVTKEHYGNVSFAPDNSRFYFTQCESTNSSASKCDIYVVESKSDGSWSEPIILPEYVNDIKATNTQPCVVHSDNKETIYFTSNRPGGKGGMDIWYTSRDLTSSSMDFTFPKNLGSRINTPGDEITPFYSDDLSTLYFSSDGHIGYGGYDIYKAQGSEFDWEKPSNVGKPLNSAQDDRYFIFESTPENGFLVSNRKSNLSKLVTTDEDIFQFGEDVNELAIKGKLTDSANNSLSGVKITLYEVSSNGQKRIIASQSVDNKYKFPLVENKAYVLEASKDGFTSSVHEFEIPQGGSAMSKNMVLGGGMAMTSASAPEMPPVKPTMPKLEEPSMVSEPDFGDIIDEEPVISEPIISEPVISEPIISEPVISEPVISEPIISEPIISEPVISEPVISEPIISEPIISEPIISEPIISEPIISEPVISEPIYSQPVVSQPVHSEPVYSPPVESQPVYSEPARPVYSETSTSISTSPVTTSKPAATDPSWYPNHGSSSSNHNSGSSHSASTNTNYSVSTSYEAGTYYKIQMEAMKSFKTSKYDQMNDIGTVESEGIPEKNLVRVMLGNYNNKEDAIAARNEVRNRGYNRAYVVKYKDGQRVSIKVFYNE